MYYCNETNMTMFTNIEYIQLAIANTYGKDKLEWEHRLLFVQTKSMDELWALVDDADEPYQMRKALHALEDARAGKPTGYTVGFDSTASGVQMFAILSGCEQSAKAVNLIGDGKRHDLYTAVGSKLGIDATRDDLKQSIMTAFYESEFIPESLFGDDVGYFYAALERSLAGAWDVLELCKAAQACIGESYAFKNPSGHDVLVRQTIKKDYKVESKTGYDWTRNFHFTQRRKEFGLKVNYKGEPNDRSIGAK